MTFLPLRSRSLADQTLFVNDDGRFFSGTPAFLDRLSEEAITESDREFLVAHAHAIEESDELAGVAHMYALAERMSQTSALDYLILVPTLRCNLSCSYCQVSRAPLTQPGFDWSAETLAAVLRTLDGLSGDRIKIEFQGGEPTLRPDLLSAVIERCERFADRQFVICTNLQHLSYEALALFDRSDVYISTSLDGDKATHANNRTGDGTDQFMANLATVLDRYGPDKVSALPTIDPSSPPEIDDLIDSYAGRGLASIFLRPINFHGFARKRHRASREQTLAWRQYYQSFVRRIIERNWQDRTRVLEETYFSICLRRIFQPGADRHVDLRNPNPIGVDYIVVDHDGLVYPTDEARMLSRSGVIDLSIGDIETGWDTERRVLLDQHSTNQGDPACQRCAYQPYCGRDLIDDIARYSRIDLPRPETDFCRRHLNLFDFIFELIYSDDPAVLYSLSRWLRLRGAPTRLGISHA